MILFFGVDRFITNWWSLSDVLRNASCEWGHWARQTRLSYAKDREVPYAAHVIVLKGQLPYAKDKVIVRESCRTQRTRVSYSKDRVAVLKELNHRTQRKKKIILLNGQGYRTPRRKSSYSTNKKIIVFNEQKSSYPRDKSCRRPPEINYSLSVYAIVPVDEENVPSNDNVLTKWLGKKKKG